jgi:hypothetical protein
VDSVSSLEGEWIKDCTKMAGDWEEREIIELSFSLINLIFL